jgi:glutamate-1-semialdehyde 2,1-aminomutase
VYGEFSAFHIFTNPDQVPVAPADIYAGRVPPSKLKGGASQELLHRIRAGFLANGVDVVGWPGGVVSAVHGTEEVERTVAAFDRTVADLFA